MFSALACRTSCDESMAGLSVHRFHLGGGLARRGSRRSFFGDAPVIFEIYDRVNGY